RKKQQAGSLCYEVQSSQPISAALARRSRSDTTSSARSCVAARTTGGATPASSASCQRSAHKHQHSPGLSPGKPNSGGGGEGLLPISCENDKTSAVMGAQPV